MGMTFYDALLAFNAILFVAVAVWYARHPAASAFHPGSFFLLFYGFVFMFRPIVARMGGFTRIYQIYEFNPSPADKVNAIAACMLGLVTFMAVVMRFGNEVIQEGSPERYRAQMRAILVPFVAMMVLLVPIGLYATMQIWQTQAFDEDTMVMAANGISVNTEGIGYMREIPLVLATISAMFAWVFRFRLWAFAPFFMFFILRAGTGGRQSFVFAAAVLILFWLFETRKKWPTAAMVSVGLIIAAGFIMVGKDRGAGIREMFVGRQAEAAYHQGFKTDNPLDHMDFGNLEFLEYVVWAVPRHSGTHDYFIEQLQVFTEPIPRRLWPGKPVGPPIRMINLWEYGQPIGITFSIIGVGWYGLGFLGVIINCAFYGFVYGRLYRWFARSRRDVWVVGIYCTVLGTAIITFRDGSIASFVKQVAFYVMPLALTWLIARALGVHRIFARGDGSGDAFAPDPIDHTETPAARRRRLAASMPQGHG
ncbi:O-antigen polymerase [Croceicoccus bisphenolivorans]|uniref:O-antigen polymerase n=1 Tax=Croceicoccus bisphenolivorans TaxID=1783232 RepID=UPI000832FA0E|nr:O-antigen polymerase [Croceicoccus bisphenolivorans]